MNSLIAFLIKNLNRFRSKKKEDNNIKEILRKKRV